MITAAEIRAKYPNPIPMCKARLWDHYCVGGAFATAAGNKDPFPSPTRLSAYLMCANPLLDAKHAMTAAGKITSQNDKGNFDLAWQALDEALTYGQQT